MRPDRPCEACYQRGDDVRPRMLLVPIVLALACGCDPDDVPRASPDGRHIALRMDSAASDAKDGQPVAVGIVSVEGGALTTHRLPERWSADGVRWVGGRLLVNASRPLAKDAQKRAEEGKKREGAYWLLAPATGRWVRSRIEPHIALAPFVGVHQGRPCIYAPRMAPEDGGPQAAGTTLVLAMDATTELATLPYEVEGAGDGWMIRVVEAEMDRPLVRGKGADWIRESLPEGKRTRKSRELTHVDVFDPAGKRVARIGRDEIGRACYREPRKPVCVRISGDHERLLLGFGTETIFRQHTHEYTFGVYDLATAKLRWSGSSNGLRGLPALVGNTLYVLEARSQRVASGKGTGAAVLAQHSAKGRRVVLELPLKATDQVARYSCSEDRKRFVVLVEGKEPRLMLVPVGDDARRDAIVEIPLKAE